MIKIENLTKKKLNKVLLNDINVEIPSGITGIIGPNGAGKSTLLKIIYGIERHTYGKLEYKFPNLNRELLIGYLPQNFETYPNLTCREVLQHYGYLRKIILDNNDIQRILGEVNLIPYKDIKVKELSGGMQKRLGVAQALIGDPDILVIDEPTSGLDILERIRFRNIIKKIGENKSVIISSHIIEDIDTICSYIVVLYNGKIIHQGKRDEIRLNLGKVYLIEVRKNELDYYFNNFIVTSYTPITPESYQLRVLSRDSNIPFGRVVSPSIDEFYVSLINN
ncbi:ATP-binding cassette domain-containing protein [Bacillus sp. FJAT-47783]|uniref:ATP-binding cassette domain-containing protein n=1 Tax=Bacillus sp. FJAT-47783 TaxID=2922712 RepID=UPI001FAC3864|nr:ATP-binding cassette domain-containing protein [Bacillus sp. FJAT-47783]